MSLKKKAEPAFQELRKDAVFERTGIKTEGSKSENNSDFQLLAKLLIFCIGLNIM